MSNDKCCGGLVEDGPASQSFLTGKRARVRQVHLFRRPRYTLATTDYHSGSSPEGEPLDERTYWLMLEFRLCGEFRGMPTKDLRRLWCDGIEPTDYLLDNPAPRITGRIWLGIGPKQQEHWWFTLLLPGRTLIRERIDWSGLLPPNNVTKWLAVDWEKRHIEIDPMAAVPDL